MLRLRSDAIAWREIDGETVLLDLRTSTYLAVNASATLLWRLLADGTSAEMLAAALVDEYDIAPDEASADVEAFLQDCRERELLAD